MKVTKGKWAQDYQNIKVGTQLIARTFAKLSTEDHIKESVDHATLIADAGNTYNECGLLPSELLKQRNELLEALKYAKGVLQYFQHDKELVNSALNNAKPI